MKSEEPLFSEYYYFYFSQKKFKIRLKNSARLHNIQVKGYRAAAPFFSNTGFLASLISDALGTTVGALIDVFSGLVRLTLERLTFFSAFFWIAIINHPFFVEL